MRGSWLVNSFSRFCTGPELVAAKNSTTSGRASCSQSCNCAREGSFPPANRLPNALASPGKDCQPLTNGLLIGRRASRACSLSAKSPIMNCKATGPASAVKPASSSSPAVGARRANPARFIFAVRNAGP